MTVTERSLGSRLSGERMQAVIYEDYGDPEVLHLAEQPVPECSAGEVLIEVHASSVNPIDYRLRQGELKALLLGGFPRTPGFDVAGVVVAIDEQLANGQLANGQFAVGDRVLAFLDTKRGGACADYAVCAATSVARIPDAMPMEEAAAIPLAGTTALQSLRDHGQMESGEQVLINGASGGVGMFAVQIAKSYQCHVDAVASGANEEFCKSLGADRFYDYEVVDFTELDQQWDLIFDAAGKSDYWDARDVMSPESRFVSTEPGIQGLMITLLTWPLSKQGKVMLAKPSAEDLGELIHLYERGKLKVTIDARYSLPETAAAHRRVESGVDRGKVVVLNEKFLE